MMEQAASHILVFLIGVGIGLVGGVALLFAVASIKSLEKENG